MAINVTLPIPPTPPSSTDKTNFRARYDAFFAYIQNLGTLLITFVTQLNSTETNINAKEASAAASASSAAASANFQGTWVNQTTSVGQSWAFNGIIYKVVTAGTTSPITTPANWLPITYKECVLATPVASATTTTIGTAASGDTVHVTGTTTITSLGVSTTGTLRIVVFDEALTLTHNATSLILPTGANIITTVGDTAEFVCENGVSGYWRCTGYQRKDGTALTLGTAPSLPTGTIAVTQTAGNNSTKVATTAYVDGKMELRTAVASTSGTAIDFTGIPSWAKRITVMFNGVSTNGASHKLVQLGDSSGIKNTGYSGAGFATAGTPVNYVNGFGVPSLGAADFHYGIFIISLLGNNTYSCTYTIGLQTTTVFCGGFSKTLSATLDCIRITTVNGTDTFDAGSINIMYEG